MPMDSILVAIMLASVAVPASALYEDQIGLFDWRQRLVGHVKFARFDQSSHSSRRIILATRAGVLASINARTGQLVWRRVMEQDDMGISSLLHHNGILATLSSGGRLLRAWEPGSGVLLWEAPITVEQSESQAVDMLPASAMLPEGKAGKNIVAVVVGKELFGFSTKNGAQKWTASLSGSESTHKLVHTTSNSLYAVAVQSGVQVVVTTYQLSTGGITTQKNFPAAWVLLESFSCMVVGGTYLVCLDLVTRSMQVAQLNSDRSAFVATYLSSLGLDDSEVQSSAHLTSLFPDMLAGASLPSAAQDHFVLTVSPTQRLLLRLDALSSSVSLVQEFTEPNVQLYISTWADRALVLILHHQQEAELVNLEWLDLATGLKVQELSQAVHLPAHHGAPENAFVYLFSKKDSSLGYRVLLSTEDCALSLAQQNNRLVWTREEALANIISSEMVELPVSNSKSFFENLHEEFDSSSGVISSFLQRVRSQIVQFQDFLSSLHIGRAKRAVGEGLVEDTGAVELLRDQFNLHRIIVVATAAGKVFGLDSKKGSIVWQIFIPHFSPFSSDGSAVYHLSLLRSVQHFPKVPVMVLLGQSTDPSCEGSGAILVFNPISGYVMTENFDSLSDVLQPALLIQGAACLSFRPKQIMVSPAVDGNSQRVLVLVDDQQVHTIPSSPSAQAELCQRARSVYFHMANTSVGILRGYRLKCSAQENLQLESIWQVHIPDSEVIKSVVAKKPSEVVNSLGRVMPNGSVMFKHLNPSLLAVITKMGEVKKSTTSVYLVDGITGAIVHHTRHKFSHGPVHLVHSENWVVYTTFHYKHRRYELNVIELYEGLQRHLGENVPAVAHPSLVNVQSQAYILRSAVHALTTTYTRRGITHRDLLIGLQTGAVLALPKVVIDPQRTMTPTQEELAEGIMPYVPELPYVTQSILNYNQTVDAIAGIHTAPAGLESTCLVFIHGLDLFFTRWTPSNTYDILPDEFDHLLIVTVLIGLFLAAFISSRLSAQKTLRDSWK